MTIPDSKSKQVSSFLAITPLWICHRLIMKQFWAGFIALTGRWAMYILHNSCQPHHCPATQSPFYTLWCCDLDLCPFDLILIDGRGLMVDYLVVKVIGEQGRLSPPPAPVWAPPLLLMKKCCFMHKMCQNVPNSPPQSTPPSPEPPCLTWPL